MDVNAIDLTRVAGDVALATDLGSLRPTASSAYAGRRPPSRTGPRPGLEPMTAFLETKTVWHPIGS